MRRLSQCSQNEVRAEAEEYPRLEAVAREKVVKTQRSEKT
jgi:hypothetical protein